MSKSKKHTNLKERGLLPRRNELALAALNAPARRIPDGRKQADRGACRGLVRWEA